MFSLSLMVGSGKGPRLKFMSMQTFVWDDGPSDRTIQDLEEQIPKSGKADHKALLCPMCPALVCQVEEIQFTFGFVSSKK